MSILRCFSLLHVVAITGDSSRQLLLVDTRELIRPFLDNSVFFCGTLDLLCASQMELHTVFSRRDRGGVPYALTDLANDLRSGQVSRTTIDEDTEAAIHNLASGATLPEYPQPVLIRDEDKSHCLILEGNKRLTAVSLNPERWQSVTMRALIGETLMSWSDILGCLGMREGA